MKRSAFTLIELLIVVAIIAILAAIAVPNFLEAQTRSKVSRVKTDMRSLATAIEAYRTDHNYYPPNSTTQAARGFPQIFNGQAVIGTLWVDISTPVAYISNAFMLDVFNINGVGAGSIGPGSHDEGLFIYQNLVNQYCQPYSSGPPMPNHQIFSAGFSGAALDYYGGWRLGSNGPDKTFGHPGVINSGQLVYDPTNGTVSYGNIWRAQKRSEDHQPPVGSLLGPS